MLVFLGGVIVRRTPKDHIFFKKSRLITRTSGSHKSTLGEIKSEADGSCLRIFPCLFVFPRAFPTRETGGGEGAKAENTTRMRRNYTCDAL